MERPEPVSAEPVDPDVDLRSLEQRRELQRHGLSVVTVIAVGGAIGASARYGLGVVFPHRPDSWPWSTFVVNASGCALIGVLMVLIVEVWVGHRLIRPFLGVGVLGGYTTFSTYSVEALQLVEAGRPGLALTYLGVTVVAALVAVQLGVSLTRAVALPHRTAGGVRS
jgi:fluoride exporter